MSRPRCCVYCNREGRLTSIFLCQWIKEVLRREYPNDPRLESCHPVLKLLYSYRVHEGTLCIAAECIRSLREDPETSEHRASVEAMLFEGGTRSLELWFRWIRLATRARHRFPIPRRHTYPFIPFRVAGGRVERQGGRQIGARRT